MKKSFALIAAALLLTLTACGGAASAEPTYTPPPSVEVQFKAFKTLPSYITKNKVFDGKEDKIMVTLGTPTGIVQHTYADMMTNKNGDPGAKYRYRVGAPTTLSVQNDSTYGSVTCEISVDGRVISTNTSSSSYGVASCSGIAR